MIADMEHGFTILITDIIIRLAQRFMEILCRFWQDKGIVKKVNIKNKFFEQTYSNEFGEYQPNREAFSEYARKLRFEEPLLHIGEKIIFK
jgi:hypothetical protein